MKEKPLGNEEIEEDEVINSPHSYSSHRERVAVPKDGHFDVDFVASLKIMDRKIIAEEFRRQLRSKNRVEYMAVHDNAELFSLTQMAHFKRNARLNKKLSEVQRRVDGSTDGQAIDGECRKKYKLSKNTLTRTGYEQDEFVVEDLKDEEEAELHFEEGKQEAVVDLKQNKLSEEQETSRDRLKAYNREIRPVLASSSSSSSLIILIFFIFFIILIFFSSSSSSSSSSHLIILIIFIILILLIILIILIIGT